MKARATLVMLILGAMAVSLALCASAAPVLPADAVAAGRASPRGSTFSPRAGGQWEQIYEERGVAIAWPGERTVVADATGNLHAVYGGRLGLYYARRVDGRWLAEPVDAEPAGGASLALTPSGAPHICYLMGDGSQVNHAWRDSAGWHMEPVSGGAKRDSPCSISTGPDGALAIAYSADWQVMYAYRDAAGWHTELVGSPYAEYLSLVLSGAGRADLVFSACNPSYCSWPWIYGPLTYAHRDAEAWHLEQVTGEPATSPSLVASPSGTLYLAYATPVAIVFAARSRGAWQFETVADGDNMSRTSLSLDASGSPHVAFYDPNPPEGEAIAGLSYSRRVGGGWQRTSTGRRAYGDDHITVALADGVPVLAECRQYVSWASDASSGDPDSRLEVTLLGPAGHVTETVARATYPGKLQKLAVDSAGFAHLIYSDYGAEEPAAEPAYAYQDAEGWHREQIPGATFTDAVALDADGRTHIAFSSDEGVRYGLRDGAGWRFETVAAAGRGPAIALPDGSMPFVAWSDATGIRVASRTASQWSMQATPEGPAGGGPGIVIDRDGTPHAVYKDAADNLQYAYPFEGQWYEDYPFAPNTWAQAPSLVLDPQGVPTLGFRASHHYYDGAVETWRAVVAVRAGPEWRVEELGAFSHAMSPVSLAVDSQGEVRAAYMLVTYTPPDEPIEVRYARRIGSAWQSERVAATPADQNYPYLNVSLALDAMGQPFIIYYDPAIQGIRCVRWVEGAVTPAPTPTGIASAAEAS